VRRTDREIKDWQEILEILKKCDVMRLGINNLEYPYIVPMNFGIEVDGNDLKLWFHCAPEGLKLDLIKNNFKAGFEADCSHKIIPGEKACNYSMEYESVIGFGNIYICEDNINKSRGLKAIMRHYEPEKEFSFSETELAAVCVLRLDILKITGKKRIFKQT